MRAAVAARRSSLACAALVRCFGGVRFTLRGAPAALARLCAVPCAAAPSDAADERALVPCAVELAALAQDEDDAPPESDRARALSVSWQGERATLACHGVRAELRATADGFRARAELGRAPFAPTALLSSLGAAIVERTGGVVLHAAAIELVGGVVAFTGPSGAGKSTACRAARPAPLFTVDRLAVVPSAAGWLAAPLPGGTRDAADAPPSRAACLPLRALLRVRHARERSLLEPCSAPAALARLREAVLGSTAGVAAEAARLSTLAALARAVPVLTLELALGEPLAPLLAPVTSRS